MAAEVKLTEKERQALQAFLDRHYVRFVESAKNTMSEEAVTAMLLKLKVL